MLKIFIVCFLFLNCKNGKSLVRFEYAPNISEQKNIKISESDFQKYLQRQGVVFSDKKSEEIINCYKLWQKKKNEEIIAKALKKKEKKPHKQFAEEKNQKTKKPINKKKKVKKVEAGITKSKALYFKTLLAFTIAVGIGITLGWIARCFLHNYPNILKSYKDFTLVDFVTIKKRSSLNNVNGVLSESSRKDLNGVLTCIDYNLRDVLCQKDGGQKDLILNVSSYYIDLFREIKSSDSIHSAGSELSNFVLKTFKENEEKTKNKQTNKQSKF